MISGSRNQGDFSLSLPVASDRKTINILKDSGRGEWWFDSSDDHFIHFSLQFRKLFFFYIHKTWPGFVCCRYQSLVSVCLPLTMTYNAPLTEEVEEEFHYKTQKRRINKTSVHKSVVVEAQKGDHWGDFALQQSDAMMSIIISALVLLDKFLSGYLWFPFSYSSSSVFFLLKEGSLLGDSIASTPSSAAVAPLCLSSAYCFTFKWPCYCFQGLAKKKKTQKNCCVTKWRAISVLKQLRTRCISTDCAALHSRRPEREYCCRVVPNCWIVSLAVDVQTFECQ